MGCSSSRSSKVDQNAIKVKQVSKESEPKQSSIKQEPKNEAVTNPLAKETTEKVQAKPSENNENSAKILKKTPLEQPKPVVSEISEKKAVKEPSLEDWLSNIYSTVKVNLVNKV